MRSAFPGWCEGGLGSGLGGPLAKTCRSSERKKQRVNQNFPVAILEYRIWKSATDIFDPLREPLHYLDAQTLVVFIVRCQQKTTELFNAYIKAPAMGSDFLLPPPSQARFLSLLPPSLPSFFRPSFIFAFHLTSTVSIPSQSRVSPGLSQLSLTRSSALFLEGELHSSPPSLGAFTNPVFFFPGQ